MKLVLYLQNGQRHLQEKMHSLFGSCAISSDLPNMPPKGAPKNASRSSARLRSESSRPLRSGAAPAHLPTVSESESGAADTGSTDVPAAIENSVKPKKKSAKELKALAKDLPVAPPPLQSEKTKKNLVAGAKGLDLKSGTLQHSSAAKLGTKSKPKAAQAKKATPKAVEPDSESEPDEQSESESQIGSNSPDAAMDDDEEGEEIDLGIDDDDEEEEVIVKGKGKGKKVLQVRLPPSLYYYQISLLLVH